MCFWLAHQTLAVQTLLASHHHLEMGSNQRTHLIPKKAPLLL